MRYILDIIEKLIMSMFIYFFSDGDGNSIVIPWAMFGVALAIVTALIIAIVVIIINQKRQIEKLKQQIRGRQPATGDQDQGSDVHLDEIHMKPDRSVHGQGHDLPASPPQTQSHDQADYEEVGTDMVAPPDISHQKGAVNPDDGSGQYEDLVSDNYIIKELIQMMDLANMKIW